MAEDRRLRETLEELAARLAHLERVLQNNTARLHAVEQRLDIEAPPPARRRPLYESLTDERDEAHAPPPTAGHATAADDAARGEATWGAEAASGFRLGDAWEETEEEARDASGEDEADEGEAFAGAPAAPAGARARRDIESVVGGSWFNWIGIIAVTFGVAFFLKYAFENAWIGPAARVMLGAAAGLGLLAAGERLRGRGLRQYAFILSGGGLLILYLSIYAAYDFYQLVGQATAFLLMVCVTTAAVLLSVRLDALPVAVLGLVGGFLTPVLLSTGRDNQVALFTYVALLDAGVLAVAYFKRWRSLNYLSFLATVLMTFGWMVVHYERAKLWTTLLFLTLFFVLYSLLAVLHNLLARRAARWHDLLLVSANATFYFALSYLLLVDAGYERTTPASHALLASTFYVVLYYAAWRLHRADRLLAYGYVGAAVTFFTIAVAVQLELHWVTIAWAVEGLMLAWVGLRTGETAARHAGLAVFGVAVAHWFAWDMRAFSYQEGAAFVPLLNRRALSCAVLVGTLAAGAWLYRRGPDGVAGEGEGVSEDERALVRTFFAIMGNGLALTLLTLDVNDYFNRGLSGVAADERRARLENGRQFSLSALWTFYGAAALVLGVVRRLAPLRYGALLLLAAAVVKVVAVDSSFYAGPWHVPVFNQTLMAYALLVLALAVGARFYRRADGLGGEGSVARPALVATAAVLALGGLSLEAFGLYDRALARLDAAELGGLTRARFWEAKAFALGAVWTLYGAGAFLYGARKGSRAWRYFGLALLALSALKALALDVTYYDAAWHVPVFNRTLATFALLVAALWLVVRTYARAPAFGEEGSTVRGVATVAANVLALVALSAEASGYLQSSIEETRRAASLEAAASPAREERLRELELARQLSLSVIWALYGGALLVVGRVRRVRLLRLMALVLLGLTTLKVFFWDLSSLDRVYRIISFIVLGAILLAVSYLYQKSQQQRDSADEEATGDKEPLTEN